MKLEEILKANGVSEEVINKVVAGMKENKIFLASEENLDVRYGKLKTDHDSKLAELQSANDLINELKNQNKGNEALQGKITAYETQIQTLQSELNQTKLDSAIKVALLEAKATDIDYMTFKLNEDKANLALDENGKAKGIDDKIAGLKQKYPTQFESSSNKKIQEQKLPGSDNDHTISKEDFNKMGYHSRLKLYNENPEAYKELSENK